MLMGCVPRDAGCAAEFCCNSVGVAVCLMQDVGMARRGGEGSVARARSLISVSAVSPWLSGCGQDEG